ncbi:MAG: carboxymuconolactone decarboxylase family protein [Bacteroidota bacterium]
MATIEKLKYDVKTIENAPANSKPALEAAKGAYGFVPNLLGTMANHPALLKNYWEGSATLDANSTLTGEEQQVAYLSASYENNCHYCMAAHTSIGQMHKIDQSILDALRAGTTIPNAKLEALSQYVKATTVKRGRVSQEDIDAFLEAGYTQENVLEVITIVSLKVMTNYINYVAQTPVDGAFEPNAWETLAI